MKRLLIFLAVLAVVAAACGNGEAEGDGDDSTVATAATPSDGDNDASGGSGDDDAGSSGGDDDADGTGGDDDGTTPDDEDFGDITGNPDLDVEDLPDPAQGLADSIDDIVSIGDCVALGLMAVPPEGWTCRVLDNPSATQDGFTMFTEGNELNITLGTPAPFSACEVLQACDDAVAVDLSDNFPDTMQLDLFGTVTIWGTHATGAELVITKTSALTDAELDLIRDVLDSVEPV